MKSEITQKVEVKEIIKQALNKAAGSWNLISRIPEGHLHPSMKKELVDITHKMQDLLIAEYARHTILKDELELS